jgi:hypothetical protein
MTLPDYLKSILGGLLTAGFVWGFCVFVMIGG